MEAIILAGGKAERLGDAAGGRPKSLVEVAGRPLAAYQVGRLARAGVTRVIIACAAGQGALFERSSRASAPEIVAAEEPERLGRGGGIKFAARFRPRQGDVFALNGDELVDVDFAGLLAAHRAGGALATIAVAQPKSPFGVVDLDDDDVIHGFREGGPCPYWVNCGIYVLSRGGDRALPGAGRPRVDDVPGARRRGPPARVPPRGPLADREHAEGAARRRGARRGAPGVARCVTLDEPPGVRGSAAMSVDSPNIDTLDRWAFEVRRVEKPWGHELIWALTDVYCGKVLFVKAGHSLSLQFHREKDESWLVQSGRAKLELGEVGETMLKEEVVGAGAAFHYAPGTVHRVTAVEDTTILEVSTPHLDDVVRLEDAYGREGTSEP